MCNNGKDRVNGGKPYYWREGFLVVNTLLLGVTLCYKACLIPSIEPSALCLIFKTHLFSMALRPGGRSTKSQTC
jgi:hypothetical protein